MPAYLERMPAGVPGDVSRKAGASCEANLMGAAPVPFGAFVKLVNGKIEAVGAGATPAQVYGLLVRSYPTTSTSNGFGAGEAGASTTQDVLRRGYMSVQLKGGVAARGAQVHVRITAGMGRVPGDLEAAADGVNTIAVPACFFMGAADAGSITEVSYNI